jgi:hypothetical protein
MPYVREEDRIGMYPLAKPVSSGQLNFAITMLVDGWIERQGGVLYNNLNTAIGVLECAKLELYRRIAAPHEDKKIAENGDVYQCDK